MVRVPGIQGAAEFRGLEDTCAAAIVVAGVGRGTSGKSCRAVPRLQLLAETCLDKKQLTVKALAGKSLELDRPWSS
jgi:hypothetical protein